MVTFVESDDDLSCGGGGFVGLELGGG